MSLPARYVQTRTVSLEQPGNAPDVVVITAHSTTQSTDQSTPVQTAQSLSAQKWPIIFAKRAARK